jgi:hypothetical protein
MIAARRGTGPRANTGAPDGASITSVMDRKIMRVD